MKIITVVDNNIVIGHVKKEKENTWYYCYLIDSEDKWYGHYRTKKEAEEILKCNVKRFYDHVRKAYEV